MGQLAAVQPRWRMVRPLTPRHGEWSAVVSLSRRESFCSPCAQKCVAGPHSIGNRVACTLGHSAAPRILPPPGPVLGTATLLRLSPKRLLRVERWLCGRCPCAAVDRALLCGSAAPAAAARATATTVGTSPSLQPPFQQVPLPPPRLTTFTSSWGQMCFRTPSRGLTARDRALAQVAQAQVPISAQSEAQPAPQSRARTALQTPRQRRPQDPARSRLPPLPPPPPLRRGKRSISVLRRAVHERKVQTWLAPRARAASRHANSI
jgi:hypothetical protein